MFKIVKRIEDTEEMKDETHKDLSASLSSIYWKRGDQLIKRRPNPRITKKNSTGIPARFSHLRPTR